MASPATSARARGHATALGVSLVPVVIVISRNFALVGNWRGRDEMLVSNPLHAALNETAQAINALFLGSGTAATTPGGTFIPKATFAVLVVSGLALLSWSAVRHRGAGVGSKLATNQLRMGIDVLLLVAVYIGCMFYAGMTSSISYGSARNFAPIAALLFLLLGWGVAIALHRTPQSSRLRRIALLSLAASLLPYAYLNSLVLLRPPADASAGARRQMDAIADGGTSTRAAITQIVGPDAVIMANNGQAVGHVLGMRTISLVGPAFSTIVWNEATVRSTMRRFNVAAVVITPPISGHLEDDDLPSPFVRRTRARPLALMADIGAALGARAGLHSGGSGALEITNGSHIGRASRRTQHGAADPPFGSRYCKRLGYRARRLRTHGRARPQTPGQRLVAHIPRAPVLVPHGVLLLPQWLCVLSSPAWSVGGPATQDRGTARPGLPSVRANRLLRKDRCDPRAACGQADQTTNRRTSLVGHLPDRVICAIPLVHRHPLDDLCGRDRASRRGSPTT